MTEIYVPRIVDSALIEKLGTFGATHIIGPKWCGKTTTAKQVAKSSLLLQTKPDKERTIKTAEINPFALLSGDQPRLIDEGANHLLKIERLIREHNKTEQQVPIRPPDVKIVLTGGEYGFRRPDGVYEIPIGCLRD